MARVLFLYPSRNRFGLTPIGISLAAAVLRQRGHEVRLFDTTFYDTAGVFAASPAPVAAERQQQLLFFKPVDFAAHGIVQEKVDVVARLRETVADCRPQLIAFSFWSCQLTGEDEGMMYWRGRDLLAAAGLAAGATGIPVVAGGIFPSLNPAAVLADGVCSHVCRGEGEYVYADAADALARGAALEDIPNLAFLRAGKLCSNPLRPLLALDELPLGDFSIFAARSFLRPYHGRIVRGIDYEFTRGCVNACAYCAGPAVQALYPHAAFRRERSVDKIITEARQLKQRWQLDLIRLQDELFLGMAPVKLRELARRWRAEVALPFIIETTVTSLTDDNIAALRAMGCLSVSVGIEHGNAAFRAAVLNKHYASAQAVAAFARLRAAGIGTHAYAMLGFPDETRALAMDTVRLLRDLAPDTFQISIFQPFSGTSLWQHCVDRGLCAATSRPQEFVRGSIVGNPQLPPAELAGLLRTFALYVLLPEAQWPEIRCAETDDATYARLLPQGQAVINRKN